MKCDIRVAASPPKPLMVFDGDCNFCTLWIRRWQQITGDTVDYLPSQDPNVAKQFQEIPRDNFNTAVQLIETDGVVYSGAEAVFRVLAKNPKWQWPLSAYENVPAFPESRNPPTILSRVAGHFFLGSRAGFGAVMSNCRIIFSRAGFFSAHSA